MLLHLLFLLEIKTKTSESLTCSYLQWKSTDFFVFAFTCHADDPWGLPRLSFRISKQKLFVYCCLKFKKNNL